MTVKKRFLRVVNFLFVALLLVQLIPNARTGESHTEYLVWFAVGLEAIVLLVSALAKKEKSLNLFLDIIAVVFGFLTVWTLLTDKFNILNEALFPPMGKVFWQAVQDADKIFINIGSSLGIILHSTGCCHTIRTFSRMECKNRRSSNIYCKVPRFNSTDSIYTLRNCTFTYIPFGFSICNIPCNILAGSCKYNERRYQC